MSSDLVKFILPAEFVVERVQLRPCEVAWGYSSGWLDDEGVVTVAASLSAEGAAGDAALPLLARLATDEWGRAPELTGDVVVEPGNGCRRVWLYLALDWVHAHAELFDSPWQTVEMIYADFDYPEEVAGFVRFMPPPDGAATGFAAMEERWNEYLAAMAAEYSARRA